MPVTPRVRAPECSLRPARLTDEVVAERDRDAESNEPLPLATLAGLPCAAIPSRSAPRPVRGSAGGCASALKPALFSGFFLAFIVSFADVPVSVFVVSGHVRVGERLIERPDGRSVGSLVHAVIPGASSAAITSPKAVTLYDFATGSDFKSSRLHDEKLDRRVRGFAKDTIESAFSEDRTFALRIRKAMLTELVAIRDSEVEDAEALSCGGHHRA